MPAEAARKNLKNHSHRLPEQVRSEEFVYDFTMHSTRSHVTSDPSIESLDESNDLHRGLASRHVQFIAIGGTIGTGLFLGSGKAIAMTGPSIVLLYLCIGLVMFIFMRAMGELMFCDPSQHSFVGPIRKYLGFHAGFFAGWSYWLVLVIIGMGQVTAVAQYFVTFFGTFGINLHGWEWLIEIVSLILLAMINLVAVKLFGETEFWFSMIKVTLIVCIIVTGVVMIVIHFHYPAQHFPGSPLTPAGTASLANIFNNFSLAPNGWVQFLMAFQMVFFAYTLLETVGVTVSEMKEPRTMLPKVTNRLMYGVLAMYIFALLAIMAIVPWTDFVAKADGSFDSPFIMVFRFAGFDWASALVFLVVITAAASSLSSLLYSAGRQLFQFSSSSSSRSLKPFAKVSKKKVPANAIIASAAVVLLAPILNSIPQMSNLFTVFTTAASAIIIFIYILTIFAHWKYRHSKDFMEDGFRLRGYRVWDVVATIVFVFVYGTLFIASDTRLPAIFGIAWLVIFGGVSYLVGRRSQTDPLQAS
jgi:AAT family amino acid transporter